MPYRQTSAHLHNHGVYFLWAELELVARQAVAQTQRHGGQVLAVELTAVQDTDTHTQQGERGEPTTLSTCISHMVSHPVLTYSQPSNGSLVLSNSTPRNRPLRYKDLEPASCRQLLSGGEVMQVHQHSPGVSAAPPWLLLVGHIYATIVMASPCIWQHSVPCVW